MASIFEQIAGMATPEVVNQIGKVTGIDPALISKGLNTAAATSLGSVTQTASTSKGADAVFSSLPTDIDTSDNPLSGVMNSVLGGAGGTSADLMQNVMGPGVNAISGTLSKSLGFNVAPLLTMAVPTVIGVLSKMAKSQGLDAAGLASSLTSESKAFQADPANAETVATVKGALDAGTKGAVLRSQYTDEEWTLLRLAPLAAVGAVMNASPSKGSGAASELAAAGGAVLEASEKAEPVSLLGTGFGGGLTKNELGSIATLNLTGDNTVAAIRKAVATVAAKSPGDLDAYKAMIMNAANATANATKEGGFLGFGGSQVSKEEAATLEAIHKTLS